MQRSVDGTIKNAAKLHDGALVESVLIPTEKRITACVSSASGLLLRLYFLCDSCIETDAKSISGRDL